MKTPTDEELNVAICEWLGWEVFKEGYGAFEWGWFNEASHNPPKYLPNHVTGIEALGHLHEAEKKLSSTQCAAYRDKLSENTALYEDMMGACIDWVLVHATSRQRAEALCRVIKPELFE